MTDKGLKQMQEPQLALDEIKKTITNSNCSLIQSFVVMGNYDWVEIIEAPDEEAMKLCNEAADRLGFYSHKLLTCFPADPFVEWADSNFSRYLSYWMQRSRSLEGSNRPPQSSNTNYRRAT